MNEKLYLVTTRKRTKNGWGAFVKEYVPLSNAAELYRWQFDHRGYVFENAKIGQPVLVSVAGTLTDLCEVYQAAGLSSEQILSRRSHTISKDTF